MPDAIGELLRSLTLLRRKSKFELFSQYEREFLDMRGSNSDASYLAEPRETPQGIHDMRLCHLEFSTFNRLSQKEDKLFGGMDGIEWEAFFNCRSAQYWHLFNRVFATVRFGGHETNRSFNIDGTYLPLVEDRALRHWSYMAKGIKGENAGPMFKAICDYMFGLCLLLVREVSKKVADAHLDEPETSALLFLLFTTPECISAVRPETAKHLRSCREKLMRELAAYISSTGREVSQRLAAIIFLINEFQVDLNLRIT